MDSVIVDISLAPMGAPISPPMARSAAIPNEMLSSIAYVAAATAAMGITANREVACAWCCVKPVTNTSIGTMMSPPPTPRSPLSRPATRPVASSLTTFAFEGAVTPED